MAVHWKYEGDYFVDAVSGNDSNAGTSTAPTKTIPAAVALAEAASGGYYTIVVGPGVYTDRIVAASTSHYICLQGDGQVIFDASNTGDSAFYDGQKWDVKDFIIRNTSNALFHAASSARVPKWHRCYFKGCQWYYNLTMASTGTYEWNQCIIENCFSDGSVSGGSYFRYGVFNDCYFINSAEPGVKADGNVSSGNNFSSAMNRCVMYNDIDNNIPAKNRYNTSAGQMMHCLVNEHAKLKDQNINSAKITSGSAIQTLIFDQPTYNFYQSCFVVSMSLNDNLSGSGYFTPARLTLNGTNVNKEFFGKAQFDSTLMGGTKGLSTAYGYTDLSAANPLTPAGGATWTNITSSIAGGFQISASVHPTGTIETAVIDQGSPKLIKDIQFSMASNVLGATGISVYTASADNQYPTRQTFEMRYGNSADISSNTYKIFEIGADTNIDINGTGSGDQTYITGSTLYPTARYIQLKLTLRTNLTGSA